MPNVPSDRAFAADVTAALSRLPRVEAIMLGGSRAYGAYTSETDWDFALYYRDHFNVAHLRALGWPGEVHPLGSWGGGVFNGGAWLEIEGRRVDIHYRDLEDVEKRIADAEQGRFQIEHLAFHSAGIPTYIVVAELALGRVLFGDLPRPHYPEALRRSASTRWQRHAEMTLDYAAAALAPRGDVIGVAGAAARALLEASHARLAARGVWVTNEKTLIDQAGLRQAASTFEHLAAEAERLRAMIEQIRQVVTLT
jgi:hypothetical protein